MDGGDEKEISRIDIEMVGYMIRSWFMDALRWSIELIPNTYIIKSICLGESV